MTVPWWLDEVLYLLGASRQNAKTSPLSIESGDVSIVWRLAAQASEGSRYQAKCANALLASAILWTLSRVVTAAPSLR